MPSISGKALISETTEKVLARSMVVSSAAILTKMYDVPFKDLKALGMELPASLVDTVLLVLVVYYMYSLTINWVGDLAVPTLVQGKLHLVAVREQHEAR